jgi:integrase
MPRKPNEPPIACEFFVWRLLKRDGVFYADSRGGKYNLGKHSLGTRDRDEALERLKQLDRIKAVELGLAKPKVEQPMTSTTIENGWIQYMEYSGRSAVLGGVSPATLKRYGAVRDKHVKFCQQNGISLWANFDASMLERYGNLVAKRFADRTVYLELTLLKGVNNWLIGKKQLPPEAKLQYSLEKPKGTDTYCYSRTEFTAMIEHCEVRQETMWLGNVILVAGHTGMRISELAGLRWSDINLNRSTIRVADERASRYKQRAGTARTTKGRRSRVVPIHPELKRLLVKLPRSSDGFVLHAARGGQLRPRNVLQAFIDDVIGPLQKRFPTPEGEIGFEHGRLHSLRHFFCSQAFVGGASEGEIREWLGHADSKMVEHYRHLGSDDAQRKMERIDFLGRRDERPGDIA